MELPTSEPNLLHPRVYGAVAAGHAITDRAHRFRIRGLDPGEYALVIASEAWMLEEPLLFTPDREFVAVVVPALGLQATVRDIETGEPIPWFRAIVENVENLTRTEFDGEAGRLSLRVPLVSPRAGSFFNDGPSPPRGIDNRAVRFEAPGFSSKSVSLYRVQASFRPDPVVWLWPVFVPEIEVAVVHDDGVPYQGVLWGTVAAERIRESVRFVMVQAGRYRARLPRGEWDLSLRTAPSRFRDPWQVTVKVAPGETWERTFVRPRGGTLILQAAPGTRTGQALATVSFRAEPGDRIQQLAVALLVPETVLADLPPGEYWVRSRTATPIDPRKDRPIRLASGGRQAVRIR